MPWLTRNYAGCNVATMTSTHPLERWRSANGLRVREAAGRLGISAVSFYRLVSGKQRPSLGLVERAIAATNGAVTADELIAAAPPLPPSQEAA